MTTGSTELDTAEATAAAAAETFCHNQGNNREGGTSSGERLEMLFHLLQFTEQPSTPFSSVKNFPPKGVSSIGVEKSIVKPSCSHDFLV